jgi:hypothetical protein
VLIIYSPNGKGTKLPSSRSGNPDATVCRSLRESVLFVVIYRAVVMQSGFGLLRTLGTAYR